MVRHAMIAATNPVASAIRSTVARFMVLDGPPLGSHGTGL